MSCVKFGTRSQFLTKVNSVDCLESSFIIKLEIFLCLKIYYPFVFIIIIFCFCCKCNIFPVAFLLSFLVKCVVLFLA